jgi:hypothetical protein
VNDCYFAILCLSLAGYALLGKGYAYAGIPPIFVGEIVLVFGLIAALRSGAVLAMFAGLPAVTVLILMIWAGSRLALSVGGYGLEAVRDSVIVFYGLFAFIVIALLLDDPLRLPKIITWYMGFSWLYVIAAPLIVNAHVLAGGALPSWPGAAMPMVFVRMGEAAVHVAGSLAFVMLGFRRVKPYWIVLALVAFMTISTSRGAMLACVIPLLFVAVIGGFMTRLFLLLSVVGMLFLVGYAFGIGIELPGAGGVPRIIGPEQIIDNVESLVGASNASNLDGTKIWRLNWWRAIEGYTLHGQFFWTGKGFGVNLAEDDGFTLGSESGLRSPHNVHYTFLARLGIPGLFLWGMVHLAWFSTLARAFIAARALGQEGWARLFLWIGAYGAAIVIDATFDVAIEGPMLGIWFWSIFGLGCAATMIFRQSLTAGGLGDGSR